MEVHAHTHTARKKWTHYFWEFLMLFLAVFCGFFAEYQLEHKIEKDREKQYMQSMIEDLKADTSMLGRNVEQRKQRVRMVNSLIAYINSSERVDYGNEIYFLGRSISTPINIFPNDGTVQQLKSSGGLRLIQKKEISRSIMAYDQQLRHALFEMGDEVQVRAEYRQLAVQVFNSNIFNEMTKTETITRPEGNPWLYSVDPALLNRFIGAAHYIKRINQAQQAISVQLLEKAKQLIAQIKTAYTLN